MKHKGLFSLIMCLVLSSCLKTRSEVGEDEQSQVYSRKNAANQHAAKNPAANSQIDSASQTATTDERDELIRSLNGRIETLETQLTQLQKEKSTSGTQEAQKLQLLQEGLTKMEAQLHKLETEQANSALALKQAQAQVAAQAAADAAVPQVEASTVKGNSKNTKVGAKGSQAYEVAQGFFANKEWKKAILNYQKYVDETPKGKEVADAKYKIGLCFQELGMKEEAMAFYEEVVAHFGKTDSGKKAKARLAKLKK